MIPPRGFRNELYPLNHSLFYSFGLSMLDESRNTALATLVMGSTDVPIDADLINVNPHNTFYQEDQGPLVRQMSIIDKLRLTIRFNMTNHTADAAHVAGQSGSELFDGAGLMHIKFLWRPFFWSFPEKLAATDDDTAASVALLLGMTSDDTNQDAVPITTTKLPVEGNSDLSQPTSGANDTQVFGDFNMTTNLTMEDHVFDEDLFQNALRRFTNKGALKACIGRTRHVNLTRSKPYMSFHINKFVPRSIRRVVDRTYFGIQVHIPLDSDISQDYVATAPATNQAHIGCKIICNYHEWNSEHNQDMAGDAA